MIDSKSAMTLLMIWLWTHPFFIHNPVRCLSLFYIQLIYDFGHSIWTRKYVCAAATFSFAFICSIKLLQNFILIGNIRFLNVWLNESQNPNSKSTNFRNALEIFSNQRKNIVQSMKEINIEKQMKLISFYF